VYINIQLQFGDFLKDIEMIGEYLRTVVDQYLKVGGKCIVQCHLLFIEKKFYDVFADLCTRFGEIKIYYPTHFQKNDVYGYIIFDGFVGPKVRRDLGPKFDQKIIKFFGKVQKHMLEEYALFDSLLKVRMSDPILFEILYNKYMSQSLINFYSVEPVCVDK
jgi:hypothetical protein